VRRNPRMVIQLGANPAGRANDTYVDMCNAVTTKPSFHRTGMQYIIILWHSDAVDKAVMSVIESRLV